MNKSDLVERLAARHDQWSREEVELAVNTVLKAMAQALVQRRRVELRGFGAFSLKQMAPRTSRNPRNGKTIILGERRLACFRSGKAMRGRLNEIGVYR